MVKKTGIKRFFKYHYLKIIRAKSSPQEIARGVSLGVFCTLILTFGLGFIIAGIIAPYFKANRIAAVSSALLLKPIIPFMLVFNTSVGIYITSFFGNKVNSLENVESNILHGASVSMSLLIAALIGSFIVAGLIAGVLYPIVLFLMNKYHDRKIHNLSP